ncbi:hypothetical protein HU200_058329 [Digitaria exilis]|uniref:Leucine-rich repeat-containing N-terminal plant-type domain-containing protein n=1 Tax=Digitaria exilis TaxID=1010633 RepID=A0A835DZ83_9POAL|nr:hypothetical protein HU200_058329 [Digitaria exilis]
MFRISERSLVAFSIIFSSLVSQLPHGVWGCALADRIALSRFSSSLGMEIDGWPGAANYSGDCCRWLGVRCRRFRAYHDLRVVNLDLAGGGLTGPLLPSTLAHLDELRVLNLSRNSIHGALFLPELLRMPRLRVLDLSQNSLTGELAGAPPPPGSTCTSRLVHLDVSFNMLTGLRGPGVFLGLPRLRKFSAESNQLSGVLPRSLTSCSELTYLNMANNSLHGTLTGLDFSRLARLRALHLDWNQLSGPLPSSLSHCRELRVVNFRRNNLSGPVPPAFRRLQALSFFDIGINSITGIDQALRTLQHCRALAVLILTTNFHGEEMPGNATTIRGFPSLRLLGIANCALRGAVPTWLRASTGLSVLDLSSNSLAGQIPSWLGGFDSLYRVDLSNNLLTGEIPPSLTRMRSLDGDAPCVQVSMSDYGVQLYNWHVDRGQLWYESYIPPSLDLSRNGLTGAIPPELGGLRALNILNLSGNALSGPIPATLAALTALQTLDLSCNELAGEIPGSLAALTFLSCFDVSHNRLYGLVPAAGQFSTFPCSSFSGNPGLHGQYCDGNGSVVGGAPEHDRALVTVGSDMFRLPFWLGMITGLCATMIIYVVVVP